MRKSIIILFIFSVLILNGCGNNNDSSEKLKWMSKKHVTSKEVADEFVEYVIKRTEENIVTIKNQQDEIQALRLENERLKKLEDSYKYIQNQMENTANEIKSNAKYEAELIIKEAKENASSIVNDALLRTEKLEHDKDNLNQSLKSYKRVKNALMEQLELIEDIEVL